MWIEETRWDSAGGWHGAAGVRRADASLVMYFGNRDALCAPARFDELRAAYPAAKIIGCSGTCSIAGSALQEDGIVAVAVGLARTPVRVAQHAVLRLTDSRAAGAAIGNALAAADLAGVFVFADGVRVDGSSFVAGLTGAIGPGPLIVGGMASDAREYSETLVGADRAPSSGEAAAVGFYGNAIRLAHGIASGWDAFGPRRRITRSTDNVLYDLDSKPALDVYERYLGDELCGDASWSGVVFPLLISPPEHPERTLVRAPLAVDTGPGTMTFAGHMPEGWIARLMRGNTDRLILGAGDAARLACAERAVAGDQLAFIVSCAGRQQMMGQRTEEELELVAAELGAQTKCIGFYSYGEIAPVAHSGLAELHNQTMIVTSIAEADC